MISPQQSPLQTFVPVRSIAEYMFSVKKNFKHMFFYWIGDPGNEKKSKFGGAGKKLDSLGLRKETR